MPSDFLSKIINKKKSRIKEQKKSLSFNKLLDKISKTTFVYHSFQGALDKRSGLSLIAEIKKASPSKGILSKKFDPVKVASIYQKAGVDAISVLTEEDYFKGSLKHIEDIRKVVELPILRKDFIVDEYQIYESRLIGADAILLIAKILPLDQLKDFLHIADDLGLESLVEIHDNLDLKKVLQTEAQIIGINNRDLKTFKLDLDVTIRLFPLIPKQKIIICESGIKTEEDVRRLKALGVNAILVGEAFMSARDIRSQVSKIISWLK